MESPEVELETDDADVMSAVGRRPRRSRAPALIVAALLVGAGLFLALRGMQQVVARAPATPGPTATAITNATPASIETPATPTSQPTPMPTSPPLILEP